MEAGLLTQAAEGAVEQRATGTSPGGRSSMDVSSPSLDADVAAAQARVVTMLLRLPLVVSFHHLSGLSSFYPHLSELWLCVCIEGG